MSMEGELMFFLGLQMKQTKDNIFLGQTKFVKDLVSKLDYRDPNRPADPLA